MAAAWVAAEAAVWPPGWVMAAAGAPTHAVRYRRVCFVSCPGPRRVPRAQWPGRCAGGYICACACFIEILMLTLPRLWWSKLTPLLGCPGCYFAGRPWPCLQAAPQTRRPSRPTHSMLSPVSPSEPHSASHSEGPQMVRRMKLEISVSTPTSMQTPVCSDVLLTQEELPGKPESGSEGSSTVESIWTTSMRSATALLVTSLTDCLESVLRSAAKAGRRPYHHGRTRLQHRPWNKLLCR